MNKTSIEYLDYTWNPIVGCSNTPKECHIWQNCWARAMNRRFKWIPDFNKPQLFTERLKDPLKIKTPARIGVCFTGDIFSNSEFVIPEMADEIIEKAPQHKYFFLSKRYREVGLYMRAKEQAPANHVFFGVSITDHESAKRAKEFEPYDWVSYEPVLEEMSLAEIPACKWLVVGAEQRYRYKPHEAWVKALVDIHMKGYKKPFNLWIKNNLLKLYPYLLKIQEQL